MFEEKESFWQKKGFYFSACLLLVGVMAVGAICYRQANRKNTDKMMADIATEEPQETEKAAASYCTDKSRKNEQQNEKWTDFSKSGYKKKQC